MRETDGRVRVVLLVVTGMSPAVLTETVRALSREDPPVIPDRVIAITTSQGERPFHLRFSMLRSHALRSVTPASCSSRRAIQSFTTRSAIELCRAHNTHIYIPHGAILGLDGIYDARPILRNVTIETIKNPNSLGRDDTERPRNFLSVKVVSDFC